MPILEVRRHSVRKTDGGSQLSQAGVSLARKVGEHLGPFARVVTSVAPRARETAIAMGFAVDQEIMTLPLDRKLFEELGAYPWPEDDPFPGIATVIAADGAYARYAHAMAVAWRDILTPLNADERALFIGHSGEIEAALVACLPDAPHAEWGRRFQPLEGARLTFSGEPAHFTDVEFIRLEGSRA